MVDTSYSPGCAAITAGIALIASWLWRDILPGMIIVRTDDEVKPHVGLALEGHLEPISVGQFGARSSAIRVRCSTTKVVSPVATTPKRMAPTVPAGSPPPKRQRTRSECSIAEPFDRPDRQAKRSARTVAVPIQALAA